MAYFVLGSDQVLSRLGSLTDTKQDLHANVNGFNLRGDEKYAALSLSTGTTVVLDLQSGKDIPLALPNPCGAIGFADPDLSTYQQCAVAGAPAEFHTLDLTTGADTFVTLPAPLVNLARVMPIDRRATKTCISTARAMVCSSARTTRRCGGSCR